MTDHSTGPPGSEKPAPPQDRPLRNNLDATDTTARNGSGRPGKTLVWIPCTRPPAVQDINSQLERRRGAAKLSVPLDCGCGPDPWICRCTDPPLSDARIDAGRDTAIHLLNAGLVPIVEIEVLQALWRRGGVERELAEALFTATTGTIA